MFRANFEALGECSYGPTGLTRATRGDVVYGPGFSAVDIDITQYANIWGRSNPWQPPQPWPAVNGQVAYINVLKTGTYLSAQFTVPIEPDHDSGRFERADLSGDVTRTSASISESCGDFSTAVPAGCVIDSGYRGSPLLLWAIGDDPPANACPLVPGRTYYLNLMMAPLDNPTDSYCHAAGCVMSGMDLTFD
ncbi:MAG: hypothetical protein WBW61_09705 [Rhodanobacteraceae bacterium]